MHRPLLAALLVAALSCHRASPEPNGFPQAPAPPPGTRADGVHPSSHPSAVAPELTWTDPPSWRRVPPSSEMRRAQYVIPRAPGVDPAEHDAELTVFYFGVGQGGNVDDNLNRWYQQFTQPDNRDTREVAVRESHTVGDLNVTQTYVTGRVTASPMNDQTHLAHDHYALLGAIVETNAGPWFFKLLGPEASVLAARPAFNAMMLSVRMR